MISRIIQTSVNVIRLSFALADNNDLGLNNSWYHAQPYSNNCLLYEFRIVWGSWNEEFLVEKFLHHLILSLFAKYHFSLLGWQGFVSERVIRIDIIYPISLRLYYFYLIIMASKVGIFSRSFHKYNYDRDWNTQHHSTSRNDHFCSNVLPCKSSQHNSHCRLYYSVLRGTNIHRTCCDHIPF